MPIVVLAAQTSNFPQHATEPLNGSNTSTVNQNVLNLSLVVHYGIQSQTAAILSDDEIDLIHADKPSVLDWLRTERGTKILHLNFKHAPELTLLDDMLDIVDAPRKS